MTKAVKAGKDGDGSVARIEPHVVPEHRKGGFCRGCKAEVKDYKGLRVGKHLYCKRSCQVYFNLNKT